MGGKVSSALLGVLIVLLLAYMLWEGAKTAIDRRLAAEGDLDPEVPASRLRTVLPLLRALIAITIGVMATMSVLAALGVDILPLLAGASVVGVALGFGSQTLVRDIVSGAFFLMDDAFRLGEYIEVGSANDSTALALTNVEAGALFANNVVLGGANQAGSISVTGAASFSGMGNAGTLTLQAGNVSSTTGLISVGNTITAPGNVTLTTANGSIAFTQANTAIGVQSGAGKTISLSAANGAVTSANGSDVVDANAGVNGSVIISAKSGIGATGNAIVVDTGNVTATNTTSGEVVIISANALPSAGFAPNEIKYGPEAICSRSAAPRRCPGLRTRCPRPVPSAVTFPPAVRSPGVRRTTKYRLR